MKTRQKIYLPFKRFIDIIGSFIGIIVCFVFLWWWVFIVNVFITRGHPFFTQKRIGKNNHIFTILKFRTMVFTREGLLTITRFGSFLRMNSIDETPQLINVLIGKMSLVGPRPLVDCGIDHITIVNRSENGSCFLSPGITGLAQIHCKEQLQPEIKAKLDGAYFSTFSFWLDFNILFYTLLLKIHLVKGRAV